MFETVLIANRGEIACRIISTLRTLGIRSVAVYSDADADARHVRLADVAVRLGTATAADSYLNIGKVIRAAVETGAQAIHPGYGFLAENAAFAEACADAGLVFIGPSVHAITVMGDKISAKAQVTKRGVPVVPGIAEPGLTDGELAAAVTTMGFPVLIKPSAGGGGKGMHLVTEPSALLDSLAAARREAASSFGDDTIFVERYIDTPRHIEVQVLADRAGNVVHLGERECSLQRRHQKVIEEAPSALLSVEARALIGEAACQTARSVGYEGVGTVEFIVAASAPDNFFFMEMNTRLQVEHPVTELVTGIDLVEWQLRVAAGESLTFGQDDIRLTGHAIEARIYAEDPAAGFLPTGGTVLSLHEPTGDGIRVDSSLRHGLVVSSDYDPMLSKVIAWAPDRAGAIARLVRALADTTVLGVTTNIEFLTHLLRHPEVVAGDLDTGLIDRVLQRMEFAAPDEDLVTRAALILHATDWPISVISQWQVPNGWRLGGDAPSRYRLRVGEAAFVVSVWGTPDAATVSVDGGAERPASVALDDATARVRIGSMSSTVRYVVADDGLHLADGSVAWTVVDDRTTPRDEADAVSVPELRSPMPGSVVAVPVEDGARVASGDPVLIVEAMKMEHVLRAPTDGIVTLLVTLGSQVGGGDVVATVTPSAVETVSDDASAALSEGPA